MRSQSTGLLVLSIAVLRSFQGKKIKLKARSGPTLAQGGKDTILEFSDL